MIENIKYSINLVSSNMMVWIVPLLLFILLFVGCKFFRKGEWNENLLSLKQVDALRGFCAIGILLHHISQKNAAGWINPYYIIHGLDFFVDIGYLFVGYFIFVSGYGLYTKYKTKENYFKHFFLRRVVPLVIAYLLTSLAYYLYNPHVASNYTWYIYAIIICNLLFYLAYRFIKNENISLVIVILGVSFYCFYCHSHEFGGWWYNTIGLFVVGILVARYKDYIEKFFKKFYWPLLVIFLVFTLVCRYYGLHFEQAVYTVFNKKTIDLYNILIILFRFSAAVFFTFILILLSLKFEFNNIILKFINSISLDLYLIQGLFVNMFAYCYFDEMIKPLHYIKSVPLYMLVVIILSVVSAVILKCVRTIIMKLLNSIFVKK